MVRLARLGLDSRRQRAACIAAAVLAVATVLALNLGSSAAATATHLQIDVAGSITAGHPLDIRVRPRDDAGAVDNRGGDIEILGGAGLDGRLGDLLSDGERHVALLQDLGAGSGRNERERNGSSGETDLDHDLSGT